MVLNLEKLRAVSREALFFQIQQAFLPKAMAEEANRIGYEMAMHGTTEKYPFFVCPYPQSHLFQCDSL